MAKKRRTKKDKIHAKRPVLVSWNPIENEPENTKSKANVKRHLHEAESNELRGNNTEKRDLNTANNSSPASVKKDLLKSLLFASLIIASEVVIYLIWY